MIRPALILSGFLLIVASDSYVYACKADWASVRGRPMFIVVGTLSEITKDAFELPYELIGGTRVLHIYDSGWIEVECALLGDPAGMRLPISWFADTRLDPPSTDGADVITCTEETHYVGEQRIWVLWRQDRHSDKFSMYFGIQALTVESLPEVEREIREMRRK